MMEQQYGECEHLERSLIGKCAICGNMVCDDCYRSVYNQVICNCHRSLEDETAWELAGYFSSADPLEEVRFDLEEQSITSLLVEADADTIELYVPPDEKDSAWEIFKAASNASHLCSECRIQFSPGLSTCPVCGSKSSAS